MTLLLAVKGWAIAPWFDRFSRLLPDRRIVGLGEDYDPAEIRYAATWKQPPGSLANLPNLQVIFSLGAGIDHLVRDPHLPDVSVVRIVDADLTARMSEYVVLHCLAHLRGWRYYAEKQRTHVWDDDRDEPAASDVRVGIMGMGVLGGDAARKLAVMGFQVAGWSRTPKAVDGIQSFAGEAELDAFLARTDILVSLLPFTPQTQGFIGRRIFAGLARDGRIGGPVFINAGRGATQNEADLLACLDDGTLAAATLDVFETEPLSDTSPFWDHPRVTLTPHNAATSDPDAVAASVAGQIRGFEAGEPLRNLVDMRAGY
jgi:glyoxylate/hydroxypyruvate reductase A